MKIALIQSSLFWENPAANRNHFEEKISCLEEDVDLIVLPEMFTSGFTMKPKHIAETMQGETVLWLQSLAKAKKSAITGSLVIKENDNFYNRLVFVFPSGEIQFYDKKHLFTLAGEDEVYTAGNIKLIIEYKGWKICPLICYDLRFPVFSRNVEEYDLLIYTANWPRIRINAWDTLLKARAIENMSYTIGVNRVGQDDNKLEYNGHSQVINFLGDYILEPIETKGTYIVELNKTELLLARKKFNFLNDQDSFVLE
ncbi:amidohydrolase [Flavobacterium aquicola]|uniref:Omega-amidase YafV n=1 Tax=Flavobacterium aquicola TaxID=1682742 RepID=A0A3E0ELS0_9FLAO|nr:amidohydrolase [Flavobacterium aquicola]REG99167.1 putative amidohydrolase [Flavobacterium aquicola]